MREAAGEQPEPAAGEGAKSVCAEPPAGAGSGHCGQPWKKFVYVEPPKRVKEVLEEELYFQRDGCQIKHPAAGGSYFGITRDGIAFLIVEGQKKSLVIKH